MSLSFRIRTMAFVMLAAVTLCPMADIVQANWEKYPHNPVLGVGPSGTWEDMEVLTPKVLSNDTGYKMWYAGGDGNHRRLGYATSADGLVWSKHESNPVLDLGPEDTWDDERIYGPSVIYDGVEYKMWYHGYDGVNYRIGYATSGDGIAWIKHAENPVIDVGPSESWEDEHIALPSVLFDGDVYKMWYTGHDGTYKRIGYAISPDGINWSKHEGNPVLDLGTEGTWDDYYISGPCVLFDGQEYRMW